jgi:hypothetical protein
MIKMVVIIWVRVYLSLNALHYREFCSCVAEVKEKITGGHKYKIQWNINNDISMPPQVQDLRHLFGSLSTARQLAVGDRVLATYNQGKSISNIFCFR